MSPHKRDDNANQIWICFKRVIEIVVNDISQISQGLWLLMMSASRMEYTHMSLTMRSVTSAQGLFLMLRDVRPTSVRKVSA